MVQQTSVLSFLLTYEDVTKSFRTESTQQ